MPRPLPKFSTYHVFLMASAVAALGTIAWPQTWAEVLKPSFVMPALVLVATTVAGILSRAPAEKP